MSRKQYELLTYYRALDRTPDILKNGVTYDDLSEDEKEQYEELFTDDDGSMPYPSYQPKRQF